MGALGWGEATTRPPFEQTTHYPLMKMPSTFACLHRPFAGNVLTLARHTSRDHTCGALCVKGNDAYNMTPQQIICTVVVRIAQTSALCQSCESSTGHHHLYDGRGPKTTRQLGTTTFRKSAFAPTQSVAFAETRPSFGIFSFGGPGQKVLGRTRVAPAPLPPKHSFQI